MKAENNIIRYTSKSDYLKRSPAIDSSLLSSTKSGATPLASKTNADQKGLEEIKGAPRKVEKAIKEKVKEGASAGKHLISQAASSLVQGIGFNPLSSLPVPDVKVTSMSKAEATQEVRPQSNIVNKPGIFFVKGFSINPFASSDDGLGAMVDNVPSSELFSWNNADELIEAISTRPHAQPIILVGHGMGSDTIVDVANRLNAVEHGFRRVDLLVTMDSVGTDNDIIPQNVKENFNVISDVDTLFNDGPNIARKKSMTKVENELRAESHSELEASPEVQFMIYEKINRSLMGAIERKDLKKTLNEQMLGIHQLASPNSTAKIQNLLSSRPSVNSQSNF